MAAIAIAGAVRGVVNALISDNGFWKPRTEMVGGASIWRPGVLGNILVGSVAAFISWALYGPLANVPIVVGESVEPEIAITLSTLGGAVLVGVGGARWLTNEVDKRILRAAVEMASQNDAVVTPMTYRGTSPMETLESVAERRPDAQ